MLIANDLTPAGVLFDVLKRQGGIPHKELAGLILSNRPLSDGRSPLERAEDRTWVSHCIVHAPVGTVQERYFCDYGTAAVRVMGRLCARRGRQLSAEGVIDVLLGERARAMDRALSLCHQDAKLYRNALERIAGERDRAPVERAESALALFIAVGCSANVRKSVAYVMGFMTAASGAGPTTPEAADLVDASRLAGETDELTLGLIRVEDGFVVGGPYWLDRDEPCEVGALALGEGAVTDVGAAASGVHARIWRDTDGRWLVEDLGSTNGTEHVFAGGEKRCALEPGHPAELGAADELILGGDTTFVVVEGLGA